MSLEVVTPGGNLGEVLGDLPGIGGLSVVRFGAAEVNEFLVRFQTVELPEDAALEAELLAESYRLRVAQTDDALEGPRAFFEKREPRWRVR